MASGSAIRRSLDRHTWIALGSVVFLGGGLYLWAAFTDVAGAVIAHGVVAVEGGPKRVQHQEGGTVAEILVKNEDLVTAGQVLLRLDGTATAANLAIINSQLAEALALEARLKAESTGANEMAALIDALVSAELVGEQDLLRQSRLAARASLAARLNEQIGQIEIQIEGLDSQRVAVGQQLSVLRHERDDLTNLLEQGLVEASRPNAAMREVSRLEGENGRLTAEIASARAAISEKRLQIEQSEVEFRASVLEELQTTRQKVAELRQQKIAAEDRLAKLDVHAPLAGIVHESKVHTVGGVVAAADVLMSIVPQSAELAIEARVSPMDIDKLHVGQGVNARFSSLDARRTPELAATVVAVAPDLTHDPQTGISYFLVRVSVAPNELARLPEGSHIQPGMPAEAYIQTGNRTVLSYLLHPLTEQLNQAFREADN